MSNSIPFLHVESPDRRSTGGTLNNWVTNCPECVVVGIFNSDGIYTLISGGTYDISVLVNYQILGSTTVIAIPNVTIEVVNGRLLAREEFPTYHPFGIDIPKPSETFRVSAGPRPYNSGEQIKIVLNMPVLLNDIVFRTTIWTVNLLR